MKLMNYNKQIIIAIVIILLVVGLHYFDQQEEDISEQDDYRYRLGEPEILSYEDGELRWNIIGSELKDSGDDTDKMVLEEIKQAELFSQQQVIYEVFADKGIFHTDEEDLDLLNNVILRDRFDDEIRSDELFYSSAENKLSTQEGVEVLMDGAEISSPKMEIDVDEDIIDFSNGVEMNFEIKGEK